MVAQGLNPEWIKKGIPAEAANALRAENGLSLLDGIIQVFVAHDGMTNEAFCNAPFFGRYHLYSLKTNVELYRYDICERDSINDYDDMDWEKTEFFPVLVDDS